MKILRVLVLIFGLSVFTNAQKTVLSGTVYNIDGAVILGTKVNAVNVKGQKFETIVNTDGNYTLDLPVGIYTIEFIAANFEKVKFKNYKIVNPDSGKMNLDISLNVIGDGVICILTVKSPTVAESKTVRKTKNKLIRNNKQ